MSLPAAAHESHQEQSRREPDPERPGGRLIRLGLNGLLDIAPTRFGPTLRLIRTVARRIRCFRGCVAGRSARRSAWRVASSEPSPRSAK